MSKKMNDVVVTELKRFSYNEVLKSSESEKVAASCMNTTIKLLALSFKGSYIYIPFFNEHKKKEEEYSCVLNEFNGSNHAELAIKYRRSLPWVYMVLKTKIPTKRKNALLIQVIDECLPLELIRLGVDQEQAKPIAERIYIHLQHTFPGISFYIHENAFN